MRSHYRLVLGLILVSASLASCGEDVPPPSLTVSETQSGIDLIPYDGVPADGVSSVRVVVHVRAEQAAAPPIPNARVVIFIAGGATVSPQELPLTDTGGFTEVQITSTVPGTKLISAAVVEEHTCTSNGMGTCLAVMTEEYTFLKEVAKVDFSEPASE